MADLLSQKVRDTLDVRLHNDPRLISALDMLNHSSSNTFTSASTSSSTPTPSSSSLRHVVELKSLHHALEFQRVLETVEAQCIALDDEVRKIAEFTQQIETDSMLVCNPTLSSSSSSSLSPAAAIANALSQRDAALSKELAVKSFLNRFEITDSTAKALDEFEFRNYTSSSSSSSSNGYAFLSALSEINRVRSGLQKVFGNQEKTADAAGGGVGLNMLEALSARQEVAYEKLYSWLQTYLKLGGSDDHSSSSSPSNSSDTFDQAYADPFVPSSLSALSPRPALSDHIREMIAQSRRQEVTRRFLMALTKGGGIELRAHDPVGYVSDTLSWIHRCVVSEGEVMCFLFGVGEEDGVYPGVEDGEKEEKEDKAEDEEEVDDDDSLKPLPPISLSELLTQIISGVSRPFKSRVLSVIENLAFSADDVSSGDEMSSRYKVVSLYGLASILLFYKATLIKAAKRAIANVDGSAESSSESLISPLLEAIEECIVSSKQTFTSSLSSHGESLRSFASADNNNADRNDTKTSTSTSIIGSDTVGSIAVEIITQLSKTRMCSPGFLMGSDSDKGDSSKEAAAAPDIAIDDYEDAKNFDPMSMDAVLHSIVGPAISHCSSIDDVILLKVGITSAAEGGATPEYCSKWEVAVEQRVDIMVQFIVREQASAVLTLFGLQDILNIVQQQQAVGEGEKGENSTPLSQVIGLDPETMKAKIDHFYATLYSPPIPTYEDISDTKIRAAARLISKGLVVDGYSVVFNAVEDGRNGYKDNSVASVSCKYSPEQVLVLLNV